MPEKRVCPRGHEYWWPGAGWQHEGCTVLTARLPATNAATNGGIATNNASNVATNKTMNRRDREKYNAYQREYMRRRRRGV